MFPAVEPITPATSKIPRVVAAPHLRSARRQQAHRPDPQSHRAPLPEPQGLRSESSAEALWERSVERPPLSFE